MEHFLEWIEGVAGRFTGIKEETWIRCSKVAAIVFLASLFLSIPVGLLVVLVWPRGSWVEAAILASTIISLIVSSLFGIFANLKANQ